MRSYNCVIDDQRRRYSVVALLIFLVNFVSPPYATWDESVWEDGRTDDGQYVPAGYEGREGGWRFLRVSSNNKGVLGCFDKTWGVSGLVW